MFRQLERAVAGEDQHHDFGDAVVCGFHRQQTEQAHCHAGHDRAEHHLGADFEHVKSAQLAAAQRVQADKHEHDQRGGVVQQAFPFGQNLQPVRQLEFAKNTHDRNRIGRQHHGKQHHHRRRG